MAKRVNLTHPAPARYPGGANAAARGGERPPAGASREGRNDVRRDPRSGSRRTFRPVRRRARRYWSKTCVPAGGVKAKSASATLPFTRRLRSSSRRTESFSSVISKRRTRKSSVSTHTFSRL